MDMVQFIDAPVLSGQSSQSSCINVCRTYSSVIEIFNRVHDNISLFSCARFSSSIAAVMMFPTAAFGLFINTALLFKLALCIKRPRHLELYGIATTLVDMGFLIFVGILYSFPKFGLAWWSSRKTLFVHNDHISCKLQAAVFDFLFTTRISLPLPILFDELSAHQILTTKTHAKTLIFLKIFGTIISSLVSAFPGFLIHGIWQHDGQFDCNVDPHWHPNYHYFYRAHAHLFCYGLVQSFCLFSMLLLLWRRLKRDQSIVKYLRNIPTTSNPISIAILSSEYRLNDSCRNFRIVLYQFALLCGLRLLRGSAQFIQRLVTRSKFQSKEFKTAWFTLWNLATFMEAILTALPYFIWYAIVPEMSSNSRRRKHTNADTDKIVTGTLNELDNYFAQALHNLGDPLVEERRFSLIMRHLKMYKMRLLNEYNERKTKSNVEQLESVDPISYVNACKPSTVPRSSKISYVRIPEELYAVNSVGSSDDSQIDGE
ncbi:hypothetical protein CRM22_003154 [Opisthorchis felineus]|uniref:G-protein coupled receptors family 1 profile domain-containing protein n=1 Tax=Opisthorchis felineus TaxID=147828 RepID=A0A4S2M2N2_OPIFE|nr:hypothetical protein CRM22_003154 [Opisthorchis felineus]